MNFLDLIAMKNKLETSGFTTFTAEDWANWEEYRSVNLVEELVRENSRLRVRLLSTLAERDEE